jgi:hypothetical protein
MIDVRGYSADQAEVKLFAAAEKKSAELMLLLLLHSTVLSLIIVVEAIDRSRCERCTSELTLFDDSW